MAVGSIARNGTHAQFTLIEQGKVLPVQYQGAEPPPDTFKDNAQALAIGTYGRDGGVPRDRTAGQVRVEIRAGQSFHDPQARIRSQPEQYCFPALRGWQA